MTGAVIMDTGPWVALIDRRESKHGECVEWLRQFEGEIYSSEAVLTEVLYLLNFSPKAQFAAIDFILSSAITMVPSSLDSLKRVKSLMEKYKDISMDYADATLVSLAEDLAIQHIVTFDSHFAIYRVSSKKSFTPLPR
jgi:predicted nucleic acid-binding protein